ncbi:UvrD-helicase domain-containing protein [Bosea sp. TND4EK4]|uniref:UvrD-helicase domain-containing protein n=1 Tax=Bosea sp. TND4EK4 TaxID=1907408 RepID=UPI0009569A4D|nr:UvrD-helicase domain-containing protein [Bosea sp. TND4EK4]SIQ48336.1 UvrD/REP helicase N-terminal domain-containing protein [Bosea sp. TND4EK4]
MDKYLALSQQTCSWLLSQRPVLTALYQSLSEDNLNALAKAEFVAGPFRMAGAIDGRLIAGWNREYLSGTGNENWGIIRLTGTFGLLELKEISQQVFERQIYLFNQRLQGLIVDGDFIHRTWPNGSQTCLAGRGNEARQNSVCYFEGGPGYGGLNARALICIGPGYDFDQLQKSIQSEMPRLAELAALADGLVDIKRRPLLDSPSLQPLRSALVVGQQASLQFDKVKLSAEFHPSQSNISSYETVHWSYEHWIASGSLNDSQRRVLESDVLLKHPVRVIGPAGSGKTLLMQLLAMRHLKAAQEQSDKIKILYVVHNAPMATSVSDRFRVLGGEEFLTSSNQSLKITTLADYGRQVTGLTEDMIIDKDAHETKQFQLTQVRKSLREALSANSARIDQSPLLKQVTENDSLFAVFSALVVAEISNAIKGRGLVDDEKRYVHSETSLSRLHGVLNVNERSVIYDCFRRYHTAIFEEFELLDSDDVAITLVGRLRTPLWDLKRKKEGFDYIFVDEAQLFNENERRIFAYLSNAHTKHVPIALALDEAQDIFGFSSAGLATLGIKDVENESLPSNHRSTKEIVDLAFHVIQQTTDLFSSDFPDFETIEQAMVPSNHQLAKRPAIIRCSDDQPNFGRFVVKQVQKMRASNVRQIAVVCHAELYWSDLVDAFKASGLPLHIIEQRGEKIVPDQPLVVLSRPSFIGGQEFDAVLSVGLEQGVVPPRIVDNATLAAAVEQQVLREIYLAITRARYRFAIMLNKAALPNSIVEDAMLARLIDQA